MMEGMAQINEKIISLSNQLSESISQKFSAVTFLAELLERLRTLDGQLTGLIFGQLPTQSYQQLIPVHQQVSATETFTLNPKTLSEAISQIETEGRLDQRLSSLTNSFQTIVKGDGAKDFILRLVVETANRYNVDAALALAVAKAESNFNPNLVSRKGAMGVMQLMPETAKALGVENPFDPSQNIDGGIRYLKGLIERFGGNITLAIAAYNAGPNAVRRYGGVPPFPETQNFVRRVFAYMQNFQKELSTEFQGAHDDFRPVNQESKSENNFLKHKVDGNLGVSESFNLQSKPEKTKVTINTTVELFSKMANASSIGKPPENDPYKLKVQGESPFVQERAYEPKQFERFNDAHVESAISNKPSEKLSESETKEMKQPDGTEGERRRILSGFEGNESSQMSEIGKGRLNLQSSSNANRFLGTDSTVDEVLREFQESQKQSFVHRLTVDLPLNEKGERVRLQVSMPSKTWDIPTVQVSLKLSDEHLAAQLNQNLPNLRQQLWEQGITLAQWTVLSDWREGSRRDPAEYFGDWRQLPSASHNHLPAFFQLDEGKWA
ncbi:MAG: transglycosylase SLT domain-containing protein [Armatimonadetes bacterium]|nr:transglycosylase SLT domain-containing protein [Armatimonadota bacterium]MDW8027472.1 transglycosylase SLT domain-containing protein [Armatimonadota bacterium]